MHPVERRRVSTRISNELRDDSDRLSLTSSAPRWRTRSLRNIDAAYFADTTARLEVGFRASSTPTVDTGASLTNLDSFVDLPATRRKLQVRR